MSLETGQVGFSQRVRLEWLEQAAAHALAGNDRVATREALQELLRDKVSVGGSAVRSNREKVLTILLKVWLDVPPELEPIRLRGLNWLARLPQAQHVAVHWGMVMAVYPYWADVAAQVGRLLKLQGHVAASQVQRRMREQHGERETVSRATRRVLRSYIDWGVLKETGSKGVYCAENSLAIGDEGLIAWLVEASLHTLPSGVAPLNEVIHSPSLFPFRLKEIAAVHLAGASSQIEFLRYSMDQDLVMLRRCTDWQRAIGPLDGDVSPAEFCASCRRTTTEEGNGARR
ncbi:MAG: hypothetical protein ACYC4R_05435 [Anaerolineae bacterium]